MDIEAKFAGREVGYDVPALPGMSEDEIQTPCLILDLDALERNIPKLGEDARAHTMRHRAHRKMHKFSRRASPATGARRGNWGLLPKGLGGRGLRTRRYQGCTCVEPGARSD